MSLTLSQTVHKPVTKKKTVAINHSSFVSFPFYYYRSYLGYQLAYDNRAR